MSGVEKRASSEPLKQKIFEELELDPTKPGKLHSVRETYIPFLPKKGNIRKNILALLPESQLFLEHWQKLPILDKAKADRAKVRNLNFDKVFSLFSDSTPQRDEVAPPVKQE